ncbi:MAG: FecR domain-containing protein [Terriglobia bacterium]
MKRILPSGLVIGMLGGLLANACFPPVSAAAVAPLGRLVSTGTATINSVSVPGETTLYDGDRVVTGLGGWASIHLTQGDQVQVAAESQVQVRDRCNCIQLTLTQGLLTLRTEGDECVRVRSYGLAIQAEGKGRTIWEVRKLRDNFIQVAVQQGTVEVRSVGRSVRVPPGQSRQLEIRQLSQDDEDEIACPPAVVAEILGTAAGVAIPPAIAIPIVMNRGEGPPNSPSGF